MGSHVVISNLCSSSFSCFCFSSLDSLKSSNSRLLFQTPLHANATDPISVSINPTNHHYHSRFLRAKTKATLDENDRSKTTPFLSQEENPIREIEDSVKVLKTAAKTRRVSAEEILSALSKIEKAKIDPSGFLEKIGGSKSPGRTWMLVFTSNKQLKGGQYFPLTAIQRFDAAAKRIENGVYLGPTGSLTFEGRFSWNKRILAFIFERIRIKVGPLNPLEIGLGKKEEREPSTKDPFFIWFYVDEEIAVARGRSGGTAFWCRCRRVSAT